MAMGEIQKGRRRITLMRVGSKYEGSNELDAEEDEKQPSNSNAVRLKLLHMQNSYTAKHCKLKQVTK